MMLRGLQSMAARRYADTAVNVIYSVLELNDDGSADTTESALSLKASIKPLQPKDVQRLQAGGIEVQEGVSILIAEASDERPERIEADGKKWRVLSWSFIPAYDDEAGNPVGTAVALCDEIRVTAATV